MPSSAIGLPSTVASSRSPQVVTPERMQETMDLAMALCERAKELQDESARTRAHARSTRTLIESSRRAVGVSRTLLVMPN